MASVHKPNKRLAFPPWSGETGSITGVLEMPRRRFKNIRTFPDRLPDFARETRERAELLPPGPEKDELIRKARQAETASRIDGWINSRGLQPPK